MVVGAFVDGDDAWPVELFTGQEDSLLSGTVRLPLASCLTADGALHVAVAADRLIAWATAMKLRAEPVKLFVYVGWNSYRFRWGSIRSG